jgi:nicotinate-nucleotide adenylyltransferase
MPEIGVSSTGIRRRVAAGRPIRHLVPEGVAGFIAERGLYR